MMLDPVFHYMLSLCFSLLFMLAALNKINNSSEFKRVLESYRILPTHFIKVSAFAIPAIECMIALGLLVSFSHALASILSFTMLLTYAFAMALNLYRGNTSLSCGCHLGESDSTDLISKGLVFRNLAMSIFALVMLLPSSLRLIEIADIALISFGVFVLSMSYAISNQLITNHYRYQEMH